MKLTMKLLLTSLLCVVIGNSSFAARDNRNDRLKEKVSQLVEQSDKQWVDDDCCFEDASLKLKFLCVKKIRAKCIDTEVLNADKINIYDFCAYNVRGTNMCTETLGVNGQLCADTVVAAHINTPDLCVTGQIRADQICSRYVAYANLAADTLYTLGTPIEFDNIIDDPNGNISFGPFGYTAPVNGYYVVTTEVDSDTVTSSSPVMGIPVGRVQILVNGSEMRTGLIPYLSFTDIQHNVHTALLKLNAGDVVTMAFDILQNNSGVNPIVGTAMLDGGIPGTSFTIHYLSTICDPVTCNPITCAPCNNPPCMTGPCAPCVSTCH